MYFAFIYNVDVFRILNSCFGSNRFKTVNTFSSFKVFAKIQSIKNNSGSDKIANSFLQICVCNITKHLQMIFNNSLESGIFPTLSKQSFVVPISNTGDASNGSNYREGFYIIVNVQVF